MEWISQRWQFLRASIHTIHKPDYLFAGLLHLSDAALSAFRARTLTLHDYYHGYVAPVLLEVNLAPQFREVRRKHLNHEQLTSPIIPKTFLSIYIPKNEDIFMPPSIILKSRLILQYS